jgi:hypothetical protein
MVFARFVRGTQASHKLALLYCNLWQVARE